MMPCAAKPPWPSPPIEVFNSQLAALVLALEERLAAVERRISILDGFRPPPPPVQPGLWDQPPWEPPVELGAKAFSREEAKVQPLENAIFIMEGTEELPPQQEPEANGEEGSAEEEHLDAADVLHFQLGRTLWDAPAVLGLPDLGGPEVSALLLASTLMNALAQAYLAAVLLGSESFVRRDKWEELKESTRRWRINEAHQYTQVDASGTSLAARVCGLDEALSMASEQSEVLTEINIYNGLAGRSMVPTRFSTGPLLCIVCLFLWAIVIARELREMATGTIVLLRLPHEEVTRLQHGRLLSLSKSRRLWVLIMALVRLFVALALLYAGVLWLAHTSSTTDLILNAAALTFVLDTDELLLWTTVPSKVHRFLEDLKPLRYRHPPYFVEALLPSVFILGVVCTCVFWLVLPNIADMLSVKLEMCGGPVDFAVALNGAGFAVATRTNPFPADDALGIMERAVSEMRQQSSAELQPNSSFAFVAQSSDAFKNFRSISVEDFARMGVCEDKDILRGGRQKTQKPYWFTSISQATNVGAEGPYEPESWRCRDYARFCDSRNLVRMICPVTCGCDNPVSGQIFSHPSMGVPQACLDIADKWYASGRLCVDLQVANTKNWTRYWRAYQATMLLRFPAFRNDSGYERFIQSKISRGCSDVTKDPITDADFCEEVSASLTAARIANVQAFCPATCCGLFPGQRNCPSSCAAE